MSCLPLPNDIVLDIYIADRAVNKWAIRTCIAVIRYASGEYKIGISHNTQHIDLKPYEQLRIYCPLLPVLGILIIFIIFVFDNDKGYTYLVQVTAVGTVLCLIGFYLTGEISSKVLAKVRGEAILNEQKEKNPLATEAEIEANLVQGTIAGNPADEEDLSLPATLGTNGIYGIVIGLGISDAIIKYVEKISGMTGTMANYFANTTIINQTIGNFTNSTNYPLILNTFGAIVQVNGPETFRLAGFLFTIIPFVHGTILMFSKKWYHDTDNQPHDTVALLFFVVVFVITILYFLVGSNILDTAFYIFSLWIVMAFNSVWLVVYGKIIKGVLKKQYLVRREWIFLNINTLAFLSIFLFAFPNLLSINEVVGNDGLLNFFILVVLFGRILTDYIISWDDFYQGTIEIFKNSKRS